MNPDSERDLADITLVVPASQSPHDPVESAPSGGRPPVTPRSNGADGATLFSVVIPTYNEEGNILTTYERLSAVLNGIELDWEIIFSLDPSTDRTEQVILELRERDPRVKLLRFSRRFGQPAATIAGLEAARGDAVVVIDCDLQDPPELIPALIDQWRIGYDVVYAQRRSREGETWAKRLIAAIGYRIIHRIADVDIPPNTGDFRLMTRRVVDNVVALRESHGFLRGLVGLVGFPGICVQYDRDERAAGKGKYNRFTGSILIGMNGVIGFSRYPLQVISILGISLASLALFGGIAYLCWKLAGVHFPLGNPTVVVLVSFFSGIQLLSLGVIGEYVGRIYDEVRQRPRYIVESSYGVEARTEVVPSRSERGGTVPSPGRSNSDFSDTSKNTERTK